jgi:hypothetical protein
MAEAAQDLVDPRGVGLGAGDQCKGTDRGLLP